MACPRGKSTSNRIEQPALVIKTILKSLCVAGLLLLSPGLLSSPTFVGNEACASCHEAQISDWADSHHDLAMQEPSSTTVLGNFDNATFNYQGTTTTFFKKDDAFWVKTDNEKGELTDYPVEFVFGVYPLQQLLFCLLYTSPSPRDRQKSRMPSSA